MFDKEIKEVNTMRKAIERDTDRFLTGETDELNRVFEFSYCGMTITIPIDTPDTNVAVQDFLEALVNAFNVYQED